MPRQFEFQDTMSFSHRCKESVRLKEKYKLRVPVICESRSLQITLRNSKFLIPHDLTIGQFLTVLRKRITLSPTAALYIFTENETIASCSETIGSLYGQHSNADGFLYISVTLENTFG
jgi:GABA(A) receptor-associated protein